MSGSRPFAIPLLSTTPEADEEIIVDGASFSVRTISLPDREVEVCYGKMNPGFRRYQVRQMIEQTLANGGDRRRPVSMTETRDEEGHKTFTATLEA